jgi:hypothetical protein
MIQLSQLSPRDLLALYTGVAEELRSRGITRTGNNPTGDLAEYLFCKVFGWTRTENSNPNIDALDTAGLRYQIKGRRFTRHNRSRQLGAIRDFSGQHFDCLASVLFNEDFSIHRAAIIPYAVVGARAKFIAHTNSHKFMLHDDVWAADGVRDVTADLTAAEL